MKGTAMIDRKEIDERTKAMLEIMADDMDITVDELLKVIDDAKQEYKAQLS